MMKKEFILYKNIRGIIIAYILLLILSCGSNKTKMYKTVNVSQILKDYVNDYNLRFKTTELEAIDIIINFSNNKGFTCRVYDVPKEVISNLDYSLLNKYYIWKGIFNGKDINIFALKEKWSDDVKKFKIETEMFKKVSMELNINRDIYLKDDYIPPEFESHLVSQYNFQNHIKRKKFVNGEVISEPFKF